MKGYSEQRGRAFKLDYDVASGQFVSEPVAHPFQQAANRPALNKQAPPHRRRAAKGVEAKAGATTRVHPNMHEDVDLTDVVSASFSP